MVKKNLKVFTIFLIFLLTLPIALSVEKSSTEKETDEQLEEKKKEEKSEYLAIEGKEKISLSEVLGGTSGVRVQTMCTNCNVASVSMCGQSDERVQVWKDGLPITGGLGAIYLLSIAPSQGIEQSEIIRGAGTVLSGSEAAAGAMLIHTRTPEKQPYIYASLDTGSFNWQSQKILASGQLGRWGGGLTFTHSESDGIDPNGDGNFDLASFERRTIAGDITFEITQKSKLRFYALNYREDQKGSKGAYKGSSTPIDFGEFYKEDIDIRRNEFSMAWDHQFRDYSRLTFRARYANRDQDASDDSSTIEQPYMLIDESVKISELLYERTFMDRHIFTTGLVYRDFRVNGRTFKKSIFYPEGQSIEDVIKQKGAFAQMEFSLPKRIDLTAGLRYDDYEYFGSELSPRARLAWKATSKLSLALSAGYAFMAPRPIFERVCCGALVQSNSSVKPEVSRNVLLDIDYIPFPWFKIRGSFFQNDFRDFIQKITAFSYPNYVPSYQQVNYKNVKFQGGELAIEMRFFDRLSYGFEMTRLRAMSDQDLKVFPFSDLPEDNPLKDLFYELPAGRMPFRPWHQGSAFIRWDDQQRGLYFSAQAQYTGSTYIQRLERFVGPVDTFARTPDFWIFNFRTQVRIYKGLSVFAGIDNITDEYQLWLDDPRYEYNWGPLRGRYIYGGLAFEM